MNGPRGRFFVFASALALTHLILIWYHIPTPLLTGNDPVSGYGFETRLEQTKIALESFQENGVMHAYDPMYSAGSPGGTAADAGIRGWALWSKGIQALGATRATSFNSFLILIHLLVPLAIFFAGRLFGLGPGTSLLAAWLGVALWFFDGFIHWSWWQGNVTSAAAAYLFLIPAGLLYRFVNSGKLLFALAAALTSAIAVLVHPSALVTIAFFAGGLYFSRFKQLSFKQSAGLLTTVVIGALVNVPLLFYAARYGSMGGDCTGLGGGTIGQLFTDFLAIASDRTSTGGAGNRTGFRFAIFILAVLGLIVWRREGDDRLKAFFVVMASMSLVAYTGGYIPAAEHLLSHKYIQHAAFMALIPASAFLLHMKENLNIKALQKEALVITVVLIIIAAPRLVRDILYFVPSFIPTPQNLPNERPRLSDVYGFGTLGYPYHLKFAHEGPMDDYRKMGERFMTLTNRQGRILVEHQPLAKYLRTHTDAEVIGPTNSFGPSRNSIDLFSRYGKSPPSKKEVAEYLARYAVKWVIATNSHSWFYDMNDILTPVATADPHMIFSVNKPTFTVFKGKANANATLNRIHVTGSDPNEELILCYHYFDFLACNANCEIDRFPVPDDPYGFIRVQKGHPKNFVIESH